MREVATWASAPAVPELAGFACVGSLSVPAVFAPAAQHVPPAGIGLVGPTATTFAPVGGRIGLRTRHHLVGELLLRALAGSVLDNSLLAVVLEPTRPRVQVVVDRPFNRAHDDAMHTRDVTPCR